MPFHFIFPVGDWSGDGHAYVAQYMIKSEASLKDVRETHFANHWIGDLCSKYGDNTISVEFFIDQNEHEGRDFALRLVEVHDLTVMENRGKKYHFNNIELDKFEEMTLKLNHDAMIDIWVWLLNNANGKLKLEIVSPAMSHYFIKYKGYPYLVDGEINFYGYDEEQRHLNTPGYGVWDDCSDIEFYLNCN
jgi:hypothetical protein